MNRAQTIHKKCILGFVINSMHRLPCAPLLGPDEAMMKCIWPGSTPRLLDYKWKAASFHNTDQLVAKWASESSDPT
jgi:hypothetical protein